MEKQAMPDQAMPIDTGPSRPEQFDIDNATKDDYIASVSAYEYLYALKDNPFTHQTKLEQLSVAARKVGVNNFKTLYKKYVDQIRSRSAKIVGLSTNFDGQALELQTGPWQADDTGVYREGEFQTVYACHHPVMPVERLINIDTNTEKLKIAFRPGRAWRTLIADKSTLASTQQIIGLADFGLSVSSETAKHLVKYIQDIEQLNYELIPERRSVSRLGWVSETEFSPYVPDIIFDGELNFKAIYDAVQSSGCYDTWKAHMTTIRRGSVTARIVLAAAFASVLVKPCGVLPFFVHMWGAESGTGKTVMLMAAASVWANPIMGAYLQTFNSTVVSRERTADFLNSLPMVIDELQLSKDIKGVQRFDVYQLAQGTGRFRGTKHGGIDRTGVWANCMITSGETPLTGLADGAGAKNRVLDIECAEGHPVVQDGHLTANLVREHFGHAGSEYISRLNSGGVAEARQLYSRYYQEITAGDTTEKQAMAAALILAADHLATDWIFQDDANVTLDELNMFLMTKEEVSAPARAYDFICDWISQNSARFSDNQTGETYGKLESGRAYIISSVLNKALDEAGYSARATLSWMAQRDLIDKRGKGNAITTRINGIPTRCVSVQLPQDGQAELPYDLD